VIGGRLSIETASKAEVLRAAGISTSDTELENDAAEIKLRAQRRVGELSVTLEKEQPRDDNGRLATSGKTAKSAVLKAAGISTSTAHRCEEIAAIPEQEFNTYIEKKHAKGASVS
jgi:hypothetical protein